MRDDSFGDSVSSVKPKVIGMEEMREELERQVRRVGGVIEFCKIKRIDSHAPVSLALAGKRPVTEGIAIKMGFVPETMFRKL